MKPLTPRSSLVAAAIFFAANTGWAEDQDIDALMLADEAPFVKEQANDWKAYIEGAVGSARQRSNGSTTGNQRLTFDVQYDHSFSPQCRVFVANGLDVRWPAADGSSNGINTLKEAYVSWQVQPDTILDFGRINVRNGVAMGYNPTDYFRNGSLRSIVSISPASLKENRQGSVMLRAQRLWDGGSATVLFSPMLNRQPDSEGISLDLGATNYDNRLLLSVSQKIGDTFTPQFTIFQEENLPPQFGLNMTHLIGDSTVANFEWSGGRSAPLLTQALATVVSIDTAETWHNRLSTGFTYTSPDKISFTAEYHYNGAGLDKNDWDTVRQGLNPTLSQYVLWFQNLIAANWNTFRQGQVPTYSQFTNWYQNTLASWNMLQQGSYPLYGQYRRWLQSAQEMPTKQSLFFYATWQDALVNHLDLSAMYNYDLIDFSHRTWMEARYHQNKFEYALQWQTNGGSRLSTFGVIQESQSAQLLMRYYF